MVILANFKTILTSYATQPYLDGQAIIALLLYMAKQKQCVKQVNLTESDWQVNISEICVSDECMAVGFKVLSTTKILNNSAATIVIQGICFHVFQ